MPWPAHDLHGQDRPRLQADEGGGRLLARRQQPPHAQPHLRHRLRQAGRPRRLSEADRGGRAPRPSSPWPRDGSVPFPGGGAGYGLLASQGLDPVPGPHLLHAPSPAGVRLYRGQHAPGARPRPVGDLGPLADLSRKHVRHPDRGRTGLRPEAHELPGPCADLQERAEVLSRPAHEDRRIRHRASLRALGRAAWGDARARFHPG